MSPLVERFLDSQCRIKRYSPYTIMAYSQDLNRFYRFFNIGSANELEALRAITSKDIRKWLIDMLGQGSSPASAPSSITRRFSSLCSFFHFLRMEDIIPRDPTEGVVVPKHTKQLPTFISESQMMSLMIEETPIFEYKEGRDHLILMVAYFSGMRSSELINLKIENVDLSRNVIRIESGKGNKSREIPFGEQLKAEINLYLPYRNLVSSDESWFFVTDKGKKLYPSFVYRLVNNKLKEFTSLSHRSPHILRHSFATHLLNNGASIQAIKELLGHSSLGATQVYTHNSFEKMMEIFKQAHPRANEQNNNGD